MQEPWCLSAVLFVLAASAAGDGWETPLSGELAGGVTARDAAGRLFPDGRLEGDEYVLARDRQLRIPGTTRERAELPAGTRLSVPVTEQVRAQGRPYRLLLWQGARPDGEGGGFGDEVAVLAVFPEGQTEPTDAAEVKSDRETYLALVPLGGDDAFAVTNAHLNAGEDHVRTQLFHLRDGRLRPIAEVWTGSSGGCPEPWREALAWQVRPDPGAALPRINARVTLVRSPKDFADCGGAPRTERRRTFADQYRWSAARGRYVRVGGNLSALTAWEARQR